MAKETCNDWYGRSSKPYREHPLIATSAWSFPLGARRDSRSTGSITTGGDDEDEDNDEEEEKEQGHAQEDEDYMIGSSGTR